jgi:hypothetical protein
MTGGCKRCRGFDGVVDTRPERVLGDPLEWSDGGGCLTGRRDKVMACRREKNPVTGVPDFVVRR